MIRQALLAFALAVSACGGNEAPKVETATREVAPSWSDVFEGTPELYAIVRPQSIKKDPVYGQFSKTLMRIAQARVGIGGKTLEAALGSEEIIVGIHRTLEVDEAAMVFRGVPASIDPDRMQDDRGLPLFTLSDGKARVREYVRSDRRSGEAVSLFVLPDRTWVVALGTARARARQAFAAPSGRPAPKVDPEALASLRLDAATFLHRAGAERRSFLGPLTRKLLSVTLALSPAKGGVVATLVYEDDDAVAWGEMHSKRMIDEIVKADGPLGRWAWLKDAKVTRDANIVTVVLPVPPRILEELPATSGGDFQL